MNRYFIFNRLSLSLLYFYVILNLLAPSIFATTFQIDLYIDIKSVVPYSNYRCGFNNNSNNSTSVSYPPCISFHDAGERIRQFIGDNSTIVNLYSLNIIISDGYYNYDSNSEGFGNIFGFQSIEIIIADGVDNVIIDGSNFTSPFIELSDQQFSNTTTKYNTTILEYNIINNITFINWDQNIIVINFSNKSNSYQINVGIANSNFINILNSNIATVSNINSLLIDTCTFTDVHYSTPDSKKEMIIGGNAPIYLINSNLEWVESNVINSSSTTPFIYLSSSSSNKFYGSVINNVTTVNGFISSFNLESTSILNSTFSNNNNTEGSLIEFKLTGSGKIGGNEGGFKMTDCKFKNNENRLSSLLSIESKFITFKNRDEISNCFFNDNVIPKQRSVLYFKQRNSYIDNVSIKSNIALEAKNSTIGISNSIFLSKYPIIGSNSTILIYNSDQFNTNSTFSLCKQCELKYLDYGSYSDSSYIEPSSEEQDSSSSSIPSSSSDNDDSSNSNNHFSYSSESDSYGSMSSMSSNSVTSSEEKENKHKLSIEFIVLIAVGSVIILIIPLFFIIKYIRGRKDRKLFNVHDDDYFYINSPVVTNSQESKPLLN